MAASIEISAAAAEEDLGVGRSTKGTASAARRRAQGCRWLPLSSFARSRKRTEPIPVCKPLTAEQLRRYREQCARCIITSISQSRLSFSIHRYPLHCGDPIPSILVLRVELGHFERLAVNRQLVLECLRHYNSMHPHDEYEPAPGEVTRYITSHSAGSWTHGNFVARRKRSASCFSFFPGPRTLFFFELLRTDADFKRVVTCVPLLDEPVTEGYSVLGFPIWWGTCRNGRSDCICKTCYRRFDSPHETLACGHNKAERVCEMCHRRSAVLHPLPGEFAYGYREYLYCFYY